MFRPSMRRAALGAGAAAMLLALNAVPATAASTQGRQTSTFDRCIVDEEAGLVFCTTGTESHIEVFTPSGRVIMQGGIQSSSTTTHQGGTTTEESAYRSVNVYEWYVDGLIHEARVVKLKGTGTMVFPDGRKCIFDTDYIVVNDDIKFDHADDDICTVP